MADDRYLEGLSRRATRAFAAAPIAEVWSSRRALVGPSNWPAGEKWELAQSAKEALSQGKRPTPAQLAALEVAVRLLRPAPFSRTARLDALGTESAALFSRWDGFRDAVSPYLHSVGRLDSLGKGVGGTGFVVGGDVIATNRHVLEFLSRGTMVLERGQAQIRFREEYMSVTEDPVAIVGVRAVHPTADLALLDLEPGSTAGRPPLEIDAGEVAEGDDVVAVGYPMDDPVRNPLFISALFDTRFGVKRGAPGEVIGGRDGELFHDCSTLGGNSGSPLFSIASARLVGVHSSGYFTYRNSAVAAESLASLVRDAL